MKIVLFDPSLKDNQGHPSDNLGDLIIHEFVEKVLSDLFPGKEIFRIATHSFPSDAIKQNINPEDLCFLGGSNILNSTVHVYNNWKYDTSFLRTIGTKRTHVTTLGVGWGEYQGKPGFYSRLFYARRLDSSKIHSVRDSYSESQLKKVSGMRVINTGCPTTWWLDGTATHRESNKNIKTCVFTLTDYSRDMDRDSELLKKLLENFETLLFFPQGSKDMEYLHSLEVYKYFKNRFVLLERSLNAFKAALKKEEVLYIGTRLHAGILALNLGVQSLIISIDNRAREMANDIYLPVIERYETERITKWVNGERIFSHPFVKLPLENISTWKKQFAK